jgi:hypothetical protein
MAATGTDRRNAARKATGSVFGVTTAKAHRTIKVAVYVQVEIDVTELENEYGRSFTATEARQDVKDSIFGAVATAMYPSHSIDKIVKSAKAS